MNILVTGSSGLIGSALVRSLPVHGYQVTRLLRAKSSQDTPYWDPEKGKISLEGVKDIDVVIHLAGENIGTRRWTAAKKERILQSRVQGTQVLSEALAHLPRKPSVLISASGIGVYGHRGDEWVDETSDSGEGFLAEVARQWEAATHPADQAGIRVVTIRLGLVLSRTGGALKEMLFPFQLGVGGKIGPGTQYMSWVSLPDVVEMIRYLMTHESLRGAVNLVAPHPVQNAQFTKTFLSPESRRCVTGGTVGKRINGIYDLSPSQERLREKHC